MSFSKLLTSKLFLFTLLVAVVGAGYFFSQETANRYKVEKNIDDLKSQILDLEQGNQELADLIQYFQSDSFKETEARLKLNLQKPGEHVVSLPDPADTQKALLDQNQEDEIDTRPNWRKWWDYFYSEKKI